MKKIASTVFVYAVLLGLGVSVVGCGAATTPPAGGPSTTGGTGKPTDTGKPKDEGKTIEGKFVALKDGVLVVKVGEKDQEFKDVKDVKDFKEADYKKDDSIKVTTDKDGKVTKIEKGK